MNPLKFAIIENPKVFIDQLPEDMQSDMYMGISNILNFKGNSETRKYRDINWHNLTRGDYGRKSERHSQLVNLLWSYWLIWRDYTEIKKRSPTALKFISHSSAGGTFTSKDQRVRLAINSNPKLREQFQKWCEEHELYFDKQEDRFDTMFYPNRLADDETLEQYPVCSFDFELLDSYINLNTEYLETIIPKYQKIGAVNSYAREVVTSERGIKTKLLKCQELIHDAEYRIEKIYGKVLNAMEELDSKFPGTVTLFEEDFLNMRRALENSHIKIDVLLKHKGPDPFTRFVLPEVEEAITPIMPTPSSTCYHYPRSDTAITVNSITGDVSSIAPCERDTFFKLPVTTQTDDGVVLAEPSASEPEEEVDTITLKDILPENFTDLSLQGNYTCVNEFSFLYEFRPDQIDEDDLDPDRVIPW